MVTLQNEELVIAIAHKGAELVELVSKKTGKPYLWYGDKKYWGRRSPVLFPLVGSLKNKKYRYDGKEYEMGQHGFARDMDFSVISVAENEIWFAVEDTEETRKIYPFSFRLEIGYRLNGMEVEVLWKVINTDNKALHFSIGAHPAFLVPKNREECFLHLLPVKPLDNTGIVQGLAEGKHVVYPVIDTEDGYVQLTKDIFDFDALVFENSQVTEVGLATPDKKDYVTVRFDAPVVGIWAPSADAPFVCIEPWYGRCDGLNFAGTLEEREWGNTLQVGEVFETSYTIRVCEE